jgi:hypothetical protein
MYEDNATINTMNKTKIEHGGYAGLWIGAWLFVIGFLQLSFWKGVLAIILWPYYLGVFFHILQN